ncbi:protein of unknown function [Georgfuchsia toluolica]|uniref:Uncharacterized protein n=1 Tax=Georgfuchsia toluolica TaxID=424218 RepID=A0A916NGX6_9PROT|nr:hypothetical protein [Georgfuchsia toluolica]CAG4882712.1 protein of unknown function [Georgfuchsia toluolica]
MKSRFCSGFSIFQAWLSNHAAWPSGIFPSSTTAGERPISENTLLNGQGCRHDVIEWQLVYHAEGDEMQAAYNRAEFLHERKKMMQRKRAEQEGGEPTRP